MSRVVTDSVFEIGFTHVRCEDHALDYQGTLQKNGDDGVKFSHICISDGCSSAKESHFGSQILTRLSARLGPANLASMGDHYLTEESREGCLTELKIQVQSVMEKFAQVLDAPAGVLSLGDESSFLATLLECTVVEDGEEFFMPVRVIGDGTVAFRSRETGLWTVATIEYAGNAPMYLSYLMDAGLRRAYTNRFGQLRAKVRTYNFNADTVESELIEETVEEGFRPLYFSPHSSDVDMVVVMSDGIDSFMKDAGGLTSKMRDPVEWQKPLSRLLSFKGEIRSGFLRRRAQKFLAKESQNLGYSHYDDLSIAALYVSQ